MQIDILVVSVVKTGLLLLLLQLLVILILGILRYIFLFQITTCTSKFTETSNQSQTCINFIATSLNPFCSNLLIISPTIPRCTPSGFTIIKDLSPDILILL